VAVSEPANPANPADTAYANTVANGGVTINLKGDTPTDGFAYAPFKDTEQIVPSGQLTPQLIQDYITAHADQLAAPGAHLGLWEDDGNIYLDISNVGDPNAETLQKAIDAQQLAVFDLGQMTEVPLGTIDEQGRYTALHEATDHPYLNRGQDTGAADSGTPGQPSEVPAGEAQPPEPAPTPEPVPGVTSAKPAKPAKPEPKASTGTERPAPVTPPPPPSVETQIGEAQAQLDLYTKQKPRTAEGKALKEQMIEHWQGVLDDLNTQSGASGVPESGIPAAPAAPAAPEPAPGGDAGTGGVGRELPPAGAEGGPGVGPAGAALGQPGADDHAGISDAPDDLNIEGAENAAEAVDANPPGNDPHAEASPDPPPAQPTSVPEPGLRPEPALPSTEGAAAPPNAPTPDPNHPAFGLPEQTPEERQSRWQQFGDIFRTFWSDFRTALRRLFGQDRQTTTVDRNDLNEQLNPENFEAKFPARDPDVHAPDPTRRRAVVIEPHDDGTVTLTTGEAKLTPGKGIRPPSGSAVQDLSRSLDELIVNGDVNDARGGLAATQELSRALHSGDWNSVSAAFDSLRRRDALPAPIVDAIQRDLSSILNDPQKAHLSPAPPSQEFPGWDKVDTDDWYNRDWATVIQQSIRGSTGRVGPAWAAQVMSYLGLDGKGTQPRKVIRKDDFTVAITEDFDSALVQRALDRLEHLQSVDPIPGPKTILLTDISKVGHQPDQNVFGDSFTSTGLMRLNLRLLDAAESGRLQRDPNWSKPSRTDPATSDVNYTTTHEWGHMRGPDFYGDGASSPELDSIRADVFKELGIKNVADGQRKGLLSGYESRNVAEFYAENYAENVITNGQTTNEVARAFARRIGLSPSAQGGLNYPPAADPTGGPKSWTSSNGTLKRLGTVSTPEGANQALDWLRTSYGHDANLQQIVDALSDPNAFEPDPNLRWEKLSAMINTTARSLDAPYLRDGLVNLTSILDPGFKTYQLRYEAQSVLMRKLRSQLPELDLQGMPTDPTAFHNLAGHLLQSHYLSFPDSGLFQQAFPLYRDDPEYHAFLNSGFDLVSSMRSNPHFDDHNLLGFGPADGDRSKYDAAAEHYASLINETFPTPGDAWRVYFARKHAQTFPDHTFDPNVPGFNGTGEIDPNKASNSLDDPDTDPNGTGVATKKQGALNTWDPHTESEALAKGTRASVISLAKEYFRGRDEKAKRGVGNVKLSERYFFDGKGQLLQKNDLIWFGIKDTRGRKAGPGSKGRPQGDGYIVNIEVESDLDPVTGQRRTRFGKDGHPVVKRVILRHFDPDYIGSEHPRKTKRDEGLVWRKPYWDYEVTGGQLAKLRKLDVTSPRAQAVIEAHGLHGRRMAHSGAGRISEIQGKVYRLDHMRMLVPIENRRAYDSSGARLVGAGDVVTWKNRDWVVSRPNNPWDNGGNPRLGLIPLGGGNEETAVAREVTYKDEPKNLIYFRGTGGATAPTVTDVRAVLDKRGITIDDSLKAALATDDPGVIAHALARNPEVSSFLEQEALNRENVHARMELDNGNGDVPVDHRPVDPAEYVAAQEDKFDAQALAAARYGFFSDTAGKPRTIDDNIRKNLYSDYVGAELDVAMRQAFVELDDSLTADAARDRSLTSVVAKLDQISALRMNDPGERKEALRLLAELARDNPAYAAQAQALSDAIQEWTAEFETNQRLRRSGPGQRTSATPLPPELPATPPEGWTIAEPPGRPPETLPPTPPGAPGGETNLPPENAFTVAENRFLGQLRLTGGLSRQERDLIDQAIAGTPVHPAGARLVFARLAARARQLRLAANSPNAPASARREADIAEAAVRKIGAAFKRASANPPAPRTAPEAIPGTVTGIVQDALPTISDPVSISAVTRAGDQVENALRDASDAADAGDIPGAQQALDTAHAATAIFDSEDLPDLGAAVDAVINQAEDALAPAGAAATPAPVGGI
jgi:hypothetical protein